MPHAHLDGVDLYYELSGPPEGQPLVLIHGLGTQMIAWYPGFCAPLEAEGFRLIRFDSRDVGLSTKFDDADQQAPYTLPDMARDVDQLLGFLGYDSAHVVGQSMGGMVAQQLALSHPERVRSLCIFYSAPNLRDYIVDDPAMWALRNEPPARERDAAIRQYIERETTSGLDLFDKEWIENFAAQTIDRSYCPEGADRHMAVIAQTPDLGPRLGEIRVPTVVIHGRKDPLVSWKGGVAIASAIEDAELHIYASMKHQLRPDLWPDFARVIARNAARARSATPAGTVA